MSNKYINYEKLIDTSMHHVVKEALKAITCATKPGNHHFYLSFITQAPGVILPEHLKLMHPNEMTIVERQTKHLE